jgi:hypothetical protein
MEKFPQPRYVALDGFVYDAVELGAGGPMSEAVAQTLSVVGYSSGECVSKLELDVAVGGKCMRIRSNNTLDTL